MLARLRAALRRPVGQSRETTLRPILCTNATTPPAPFGPPDTGFCHWLAPAFLTAAPEGDGLPVGIVGGKPR